MENLDQFKKDVHAALRAWHTSSGTPQNLLSDLLLVRERLEEFGVHNNPTFLRLATNQVLLDGIHELGSNDEDAERVLTLRFPDNNSLFMVANQLNVSDHTVSRMQKAAIEQLALTLHSHEQAARQARSQRVESEFPPAAYAQLFGIKTLQQELRALLLSPEKPWVLALVGLGGIGKTALADSTARQIVHEFYFTSVIWLRITPQSMSGQVSSPQVMLDDLITDLTNCFWPDEIVMPENRLAQVRQQLKSQPYLIVIDNLESETDTAFLLNYLNDLAEPSKFLLTTRTRPAPQSVVYSLSVEELAYDDAVSLMKAHAVDVGIKAFELADEIVFKDIYHTVGGNPLALKLVVSLLDLLPLSQVLAGMVQGHQGEIEKLYRHIYWQTWATLSDNGRSLLLAMPLVAEQGGDTEYLKAISGLDDAQLWPAVYELRSRSLLEVRGNLLDKRYGIHRLTETFVQTEIIDWPHGQLAME